MPTGVWEIFAHRKALGAVFTYGFIALVVVASFQLAFAHANHTNTNPPYTSIMYNGHHGPTTPEMRFKKENVWCDDQCYPDTLAEPTDDWWIDQFHRTEYISPGVMYLNSTRTYNDPLWGWADYAWPTPLNSGHLWVWDTGNPDPAKKYLFELYGQNGGLTSEGGVNLFLHNRVDDSVMNKKVMYWLDTSIRDVSPPGSHPDTAWQSLSGFIFHYDASGDTTAQNHVLNGTNLVALYVQIYHYDTRGVTLNTRWMPNGFALYSNKFAHDSYGLATTSEQALGFDLTKYLCHARQQAYNGTARWDTSYYGLSDDLNRWQVSSMYVGIEHQKGQESDRIWGSLRIRNVDLRRMENEPRDYCSNYYNEDGTSK